MSVENQNYSPDSGKKYKSDGSIVYDGDIAELVSEIVSSSMGGNGGAYVTVGTYEPPDGYHIAVIEARTESSITAVGNVTGIATRTLEVNGKFYGKYTSVTIHSGEAILYYGVS